MGAHESTLVSNALAVACVKLQTEKNIEVEISKSLLESMRKLWPYLPEEIQNAFKDCHCLPRNRKKPKASSQSHKPRIPPDIINNMESWIADPFKLFEIEGSSFKTTDDPLVGINAYAERLHQSNDDMTQVRARFMKIFYHKLSQVGYLSKARKKTKRAIVSKSGLATTDIDISLETSDGTRLSLLCLDVSSSHQRADSEERADSDQRDVNPQHQTDNSHLRYLFALPKYVSYRYLRDIPMAGEKRKQAIDRLKKDGILQIDHQQKLSELANAIMTRIWEPMKARISGSGFETFRISNFSSTQKTPLIPNMDNDASTTITISTISDSRSPSESAILTEEIRGTFSTSNLRQDIQHTPYPVDNRFSLGLGTDTMASFSMHQNALPIPPASEVLDTTLTSGLEQTGLHTSYPHDRSPELGLDADVMASFSMHQNALPIPPVENSLRIFSATSLMMEDHDASPSVHESTLPIQPLDRATDSSFPLGQGSTASGNSNSLANAFNGLVCSSNQPTFGADYQNYTGILGGETPGIPASGPRSEIRVSVS